MTTRRNSKKAIQEATVWVEGLDRLNAAVVATLPASAMVIDLSATPFRIKGSNYPEGQPFPWIVSDFGSGGCDREWHHQDPASAGAGHDRPTGSEILPPVGGDTRQSATRREAAGALRQAEARRRMARGARRARCRSWASGWNASNASGRRSRAWIVCRRASSSSATTPTSPRNSIVVSAASR